MLIFEKKRLLIGLAILATLVLLALAQPAQAQERPIADLPNPGIMPDSFWYFGEILKERITLIFTFDKAEKLEKYLNFGEERISEAKVMADQNRSRETITALDEYISLMKRAEATAKLIDQARLVEDSQELISRLITQLFYLDLLLKKTTDQMVKPKLKEAKVWAENVQKIIPQSEE